MLSKATEIWAKLDEVICDFPHRSDKLIPFVYYPVSCPSVMVTSYCLCCYKLFERIPENRDIIYSSFY